MHSSVRAVLKDTAKQLQSPHSYCIQFHHLTQQWHSWRQEELKVGLCVVCTRWTEPDWKQNKHSSHQFCIYVQNLYNQYKFQCTDKYMSVRFVRVLFYSFQEIQLIPAEHCGFTVVSGVYLRIIFIFKWMFTFLSAWLCHLIIHKNEFYLC